VAHLAALLEVDPATPTIVVTDTVFSMDGDAAPVEEIAALCRRRGALLLLDEAHAVLGPRLPAGLTADAELTLVRMGTLSKTLGALGGFLAGPRDVIELMVNAARPYIFTTGLSPADAAAALAALGVLRSPEGDALVRRLADLVARVEGEDPVGGRGRRAQRASPIIPVILGTEQRALEASAALLADGLWVPAIRPPTVPAGTSRLRVTVSAAHTDDQVRALVEALAPLRAARLARAH
jgi:7-keto-8-aminopelargonate synthetase-like enzyme